MENEYVSGSDFEDELLGFPDFHEEASARSGGTLDSDPLPSHQPVNLTQVDEVQSVLSPGSPTTNSVAGTWKRTLRTRTFAQQRPYSYDKLMYRGLGLDPKDVRELQIHKSDDEDYEYQGQEEEDPVLLVDSQEGRELFEDENDSPARREEKRLEREKRKAELEQRRVERDRRKVELEQRRQQKEKKKVVLEQQRLEKEKKKALLEQKKLEMEETMVEEAEKKRIHRTDYQRFFLPESDDEDGDLPPPLRINERSSSRIHDEPEIDRMETTKRPNINSGNSKTKRRKQDYVAASTAKTRRKPRALGDQQIIDFFDGPPNSQQKSVLATVRAMAQSTKQLVGRRSRYLSQKPFKEDRHWLDDGGGRIGSGRGGRGRTSSSSVYRPLPRIKDPRAAPLEPLRRYAWNQIQERKIAKTGVSVSRGPRNPYTRLHPKNTKNEGYINEYGVRILPSDKVPITSNTAGRSKPSAGVRIMQPMMRHVRLEAVPRAQRFNEQISGEYAIRRRAGVSSKIVPPQPEIEPEPVPFVGLTEMIEGRGDQEELPKQEAQVDSTFVEFSKAVSTYDTFETTFGLVGRPYELENPVFLGKLDSPLESWLCPVLRKIVTVEDTKTILKNILQILPDFDHRERVLESLRLLLSHSKLDLFALEEFQERVLALDLGDLCDLIVSAVNIRTQSHNGEPLISTDKLYIAVKDNARPLLVEAAILRKDKITIPHLCEGIPTLEKSWRSLFVAKSIGRDESNALFKLLDILPPVKLHDRDLDQVDYDRYKKILLIRTQALWRFNGHVILWWARNTPYPYTEIPELDLDYLAATHCQHGFFTVAKMVSEVYKSGKYGPATIVAGGITSGAGMRFPRNVGFHRNKLRMLAQTYIYLMIRLRDIYDPDLRPSLEQLQDTVYSEKAHLEVTRIEFSAVCQTLKIVSGSGFTERNRTLVKKWLNLVIVSTTNEYVEALAESRIGLAREYESLLIRFFHHIDDDTRDGPIKKLLMLERGWKNVSETMNRALVGLILNSASMTKTLLQAFAVFVSRLGPKYYPEFAKLHPNPCIYPMPQQALWITTSLKAGTHVDATDVTFVAVKSVLERRVHEPLWNYVVELQDVAISGLSNETILEKIMLAMTSKRLAGQICEYIRNNLDFLKDRLLVQRTISYLKGNHHTQTAPQLQWFLNPSNFELQADSAQLAKYSSMLKQSQHAAEIKNYLLGSLSMSLILDGGSVFFEAVKELSPTHSVHVSTVLELFESLVSSSQSASKLFLPLFLRLATAMASDSARVRIWYTAYERIKQLDLENLSPLENAYLSSFLHLTTIIPPSEQSMEVLLDVLQVPYSTTCIAPSVVTTDADVESSLGRFKLDSSGEWFRGIGNSKDYISLHFILSYNLTTPYDAVIQCLSKVMVYSPELSVRLEHLTSKNYWIGRFLGQHLFQAPQVSTIDEEFI